ncbi:flippase-like domain-containing protein [candidate division KSB1 bacterium]|nr:flippase-like domain-containing protein [candidate division KSB1 bacterium]
MNTPTTTIDFQKIIKMAQYLIPIGIGGNLIFSYFTTDKDAFTNLDSFSMPYLWLCLMLCFIPWLTHALRMLLWTRFFGGKNKFVDLIRIAIGTDLGSAITPTAMGGGYLKAGMFIQQGFDPATAVALMFLGSIEDYTFFLISMPVFFYYTQSRLHPMRPDWQLDFSKLVLIIAVLVGIIAGLMLIRWLTRRASSSRFAPLARRLLKVGSFLKEIRQVFRLIGSKGKGLFILTVVITAIHWICKYSIVMVLLYSVGIQVNPAEFILYQWLVSMISLFIPTPGGSGGAEASFFLIFKNLVPAHLIGFITIAWRLFTYYLQLGIGMLVFMLIPTAIPLETE